VVLASHLEASHQFGIRRFDRAGLRGAIAHDAIGGIELRPLLQQLLAGAALVFPAVLRIVGRGCFQHMRDRRGPATDGVDVVGRHTSLDRPWMD
jgi:hypothetical protein